MERIKGTINIGRPSSLYHDKVCIQVTDTSSRTRFLEVWVGLADFTKALTGQYGLPCDLEVRDLDKVGLVKETKELVFPVGKSHYSSDAEEACHQYADEGWTANTYFGSRDSFRTHEDGKRYAHGTQYRYVRRKDGED